MEECKSENLPNCTWDQFKVCNDNQTEAFEDLSKQLFYQEILRENDIPHANAQNPGVEVDPVLEPPHEDGSKRRWVSFQSKYFDKSIGWGKIRDSANKTIKYYKGKIDHVYLFCNLTVSKNTQGYRSVEAILKKEGISLQPISNKDILNLVPKHRNIANYFFLRREVSYDLSGLRESYIPIINRAAEEKPSTGHASYTVVTAELIREKTESCRQLLLELNFSDLSKELEKLLLHDLSQMQEAEVLYYYRYLTDLRIKGSEASPIPVTESYQLQIDWIKAYYKAPTPLSTGRFLELPPELQVLVLDKMFSTQLWDAIIRLYDSKPNTEEPVKLQLAFHAGLSCFNVQAYERAAELLDALAGQKTNDKYGLFALCAHIRKIIILFRDDNRKDADQLASYIERLGGYRNTKGYKENDLLMALIYMESYCYLGCRDQKYLGKAFSVYETFSDEVKSNKNVRYQLAVCRELNDDREEAIGIYNTLDWISDENVAQRYMVALVESGRESEAIEKYQQIEDKTPRVAGAYLLALYRTKDKTYKEVLCKELDHHRASFEAVFLIAFYVEDGITFDEVVVPVIEELIGRDMSGLPVQIKNGYALLLAKWKKIELLDAVISAINDLTLLSAYINHEIYKALFETVHKEYVKEERRLLRNPEIEAANRIAGRMIEAEVNKERFLQIRLMYAGIMEMKISMLQYAKQFFELTKDEATARNIIALLYDRGETDPREYEPYVEALRYSDHPDYCIAVASAMLKQGKIEEADLFAYKALYYLNGKDDFNIYKSYFGYHNANLGRYNDGYTGKTAGSGRVVVLEDVDNPTSEKQVLCIDPESELNDPENRSMGIKHILRTDTAFAKLQSGGIKQEITIRGKRWRIIDIIPRDVYAGQFIFKIINKYPEKFEGSVWVISTADPQEMLKQIMALTDRTEHTKTLLRTYNREDNGIGIPIDVLVAGDYSRYIDALRLLLFVKDQAFYAGYPKREDFDGSPFIPTLSTMMLLAQMGWMHLLEGLGKDVIIPESYLRFFREQYEKVVSTQAISPGTLCCENGQVIMYEPDRKLPEIWESLVDFCGNAERAEITDEERMSFPFIEEMTGEQLITGFKLELIQLDALILAKKLDGYYICDDYFFRQVAALVGIKDINFASLLFHMQPEAVSTFIMELSKTNYIHTPYLPSSEDEAVQLRENLMTGKRKKAYYSAFFNMAQQIWQQVLREWFDVTDPS